VFEQIVVASTESGLNVNSLVSKHYVQHIDRVKEPHYVQHIDKVQESHYVQHIDKVKEYHYVKHIDQVKIIFFNYLKAFYSVSIKDKLEFYDSFSDSSYMF